MVGGVVPRIEDVYDPVLGVTKWQSAVYIVAEICFRSADKAVVVPFIVLRKGKSSAFSRVLS